MRSDRRLIVRWLSLGLLLVGSPLACGNAERHEREKFARDLAQHAYPRTGLALANVVDGGIHDLWTDTVCKSSGGGSRHLHSPSHTHCETTRLGFKDGAGNSFVFHVAAHSPTRDYYLVPLSPWATQAMATVTGMAVTPSALGQYLAYDEWLAEVLPRWRGLAPSIVDSRSPPANWVEATVRLAAEGGRPLAFVRSRFRVDFAVADNLPYFRETPSLFREEWASKVEPDEPVDPAARERYAHLSLARPSYELRELQLAFPDEDFFSRRGTEIIAVALTPHIRDLDWKREAAKVVRESLEMIERCTRYRSRTCSTRVEMETIESWPDVEVERSSGELRVTFFDRPRRL